LCAKKSVRLTMKKLLKQLINSTPIKGPMLAI
jgi:hypothetical protein